MSKPNLSKTQFLIEAIGPSRAFRRKRSTGLFNKAGEFIRLTTAKEFWELKQAWPEEVKADGLTLRTIWTLIEI